ncbi:MAG: Apocarotenoid-15,15'-oxygenase [Merismopedia sp. SIO2A8]|nr:Apocarotenoid-15,15'-oxygenase [Symploca sp. SIO2B6]NET48827.1 Apocarotenoid-15,15'-oxygenase [Merismopedia sp. SIO2A8]
MQASTTLSYSRRDWQQGYRSLRNEFDYWIDEIEGTIPPELTGTLFRNGPGLLDVNGQRLHHPFDGDGMICAIAFKEGRAHFRNRFVRTKEYLTEQQAGKICYRGVFGTEKPGGWLANMFDVRLKNIANTQVIYWGGKLLALWEAAQPYGLDPKTLETIGLDNLGGGLNPGESFAAHPWVDPACKADQGDPCLVNFSVSPGLSTKITLYELDLRGIVVRKKSHSIPGFAFLHDCAITPNYVIFFQNPVKYNPLPFVMGMKSAAQCIQVAPDQPTRIILIPRHHQGAPIILPTQAGFVFHHVNAFEQDGQVVVDSVCYDGFPVIDENEDYLNVDFDHVLPGRLHRFHLDLTQKSVQVTCLADRSCEFPQVHPQHVGRPYRYTYIGATHADDGNAPLQAIWKVDMENPTQQQLWSFAPRGFIGEPIFVPRPGSDIEDDGWILTLVFNAERNKSELAILEAHSLSQGPVATLKLKHHVPYGLHGSFTWDYLGPDDP